MPSSNVIQFSTSSLANSIKKGNAILGISSVDYGPTSTTGFWNGITPPSGGYTIYVSRSTAGPNIYTPTSDSELITYSSKIANIPFTSTSGALAWFATQSNSIVVNKSYPDIVTNGLILLNDASFTPSYPTTASVWYDVSGNNKNGSLINGPLFDPNRGAIVFDGINEIVTYGTGNTFFPLPSFSIELTFQSKGTVPTTGTAPGLFGFTYGIRALFTSANNIQFGVSSGSSAGNQPLNYTHTSNFRDDGKWYNIIFQATPTNSYIYLNGELKASRSVVWLGDTVWPTNGWNLARDNNNVNYFFTGSISNFKMYNKALTQAEINQNYYGGPIVTNGLVFAVDASNLVSYESGSTITYSLTGSLSGSLINGVGYSNINGGTWNFDGVDDYIIITGSSILQPASAITLEAVFQRDGGRTIINYGADSSGAGKIYCFEQSSNLSAFQAKVTTTTSGQVTLNGPILSTGTWYHAVMTYNGSIAILYINGLFYTSATASGNINYPANSNLNLGRKNVADGEYISGKIAFNRIYNRALSATEVSQNFNAQRSRFGI